MKDSAINNKWVFLIILALSVIAYFNSIGNSFHYDDKFYIEDNFYVRDISNIPGSFLHPSYLAADAPSGHYRPLLFASYAINYYLGGLNPAGYRLVNLAFHVGSAFLVFLILQAMFTPTPSLPRLSYQRGGEKKGVGSSPTTYYLLPTTYIPLASALIFAVHPFNSEVVNYISTRSSVMSGFFYLLAFYCWVKYRQGTGSSEQVAGGSPPTTYYLLPTTYYYIASLLAFLAGMLTKETVITLPIVLWLYDIYFNRTSHPPLNPLPSRVPTTYYLPPTTLIGYARRLIVYSPFVFIIAAAYFVVRLFYWGSFLPYFKRGLLTQFYTEMPVLAKFIRLLFIPSGLNVDHYVLIYNQPVFPVIVSLLLLVLFIAIAVWLYRSSRIEWKALSFFMFWFFIVLLPTTVMPLNAILQENRGYVAGIGFAILIGIGIHRIATLPILALRPGRLDYIFPLAGLLIILFIYSALTIQRNTVWRDGVTLWEDTVSKSPLSPAAHHNLAWYLEEKKGGRFAIKEYQRVIELEPSHAISYYNLGRLYRGLGMTEEAIKVYQEAIRISPDYYKVYNNLGIIYDDMGRSDSAIGEFKKAITINPGYVIARMNLGKMYEKRGRMDLAADEFEAVIRLARPGSGEEKKAYEAANHLKWIKGMKNTQ